MMFCKNYCNKVRGTMKRKMKYKPDRTIRVHSIPSSCPCTNPCLMARHLLTTHNTHQTQQKPTRKTHRFCWQKNGQRICDYASLTFALYHLLCPDSSQYHHHLYHSHLSFQKLAPRNDTNCLWIRICADTLLFVEFAHYTIFTHGSHVCGIHSKSL